MQPMYSRHVRPLVVEALKDTRIVFVAGARQVGKTTLATEIASRDHPMAQFSLDDQATLEGAVRDPQGFVAGVPGPALIDEVQRAPDLLLAIKEAVDVDQTPGRFLLTGSANVLTSKRVKDALTGRIETVRLWPLSQAEINGGRINFVDALLDAKPPYVTGAPTGREAFAGLVAAGGYPEARRRSGRRRDRWFENYLETALDRDLRDITDAIKLAEMPGLLRLLASQTANVLAYRSVAARLDIDHKTVKAYVGLLEQMFLVIRLPAWRPGLGAREAAKPKIYVVDTGLLAYLLGADEKRIANDDQVTGKALENLVAMEVLRHSEWAQSRVRIYHYQRDREDIDLILERADGAVAAVEVKAGTTVQSADYKSIEKLRDRLNHRFISGVVVCASRQTTPLGDRIWAVPVSGLWT